MPNAIAGRGTVRPKLEPDMAHLNFRIVYISDAVTADVLRGEKAQSPIASDEKQQQRVIFDA